MQLFIYSSRPFQFSLVQSLSCVLLFATPWTVTCQASLSITNSQRPPKPMSIESAMPSNHLVLCRPLLLLSSLFPNIRVFSFFFFFFFIFIFFVVNFVIHWNETSLSFHVFPIPIPPPTSLSTRSLQVLPEHQGLFKESVLHIRWPKYWSFN